MGEEVDARVATAHVQEAVVAGRLAFWHRVELLVARNQVEVRHDVWGCGLEAQARAAQHGGIGVDDFFFCSSRQQVHLLGGAVLVADDVEHRVVEAVAALAVGDVVAKLIGQVELELAHGHCRHGDAAHEDI